MVVVKTRTEPHLVTQESVILVIQYYHGTPKLPLTKSSNHGSFLGLPSILCCCVLIAKYRVCNVIVYSDHAVEPRQCKIERVREENELWMHSNIVTTAAL